MTTITEELIDLLRQARSLGLTFHIGSAYISRAYIDKQTELNARIKDVIARAEAMSEGNPPGDSPPPVRERMSS